MNNLNNKDYKQILNFYNLPIPKTNKNLKESAEKILYDKLCRCIQKVSKKNEKRAIGICTKTIINRKGLTRGIFNCKEKRVLQIKKNKTIKIKQR